MTQYDMEWEYYYMGETNEIPKIKVGHTLSPVKQLTGCAVVIDIIENDFIVYMTDFGNVCELRWEELLNNYRVTGFSEDVFGRINTQIQKLEKVKKRLNHKEGI